MVTISQERPRLLFLEHALFRVFFLHHTSHSALLNSNLLTKCVSSDLRTGFCLIPPLPVHRSPAATGSRARGDSEDQLQKELGCLFSLAGPARLRGLSAHLLPLLAKAGVQQCSSSKNIAAGAQVCGFAPCRQWSTCFHLIGRGPCSD